jgi:hypothetical protein
VIAIKEAVGHRIKCPICGEAASVEHARQRVDMNKPHSAPIPSAHMWYLVDCKRSGKKLYKHDTKVEVVQ